MTRLPRPTGTLPGSANTGAGTEPPIDATTALEPLLDDLIGAHDRLITALVAHREAMRQADGNALSLIIADEHKIYGELRDLEHRRASVAAAVHGPETKLSELAKGLPEPSRGRCLAKCEQLRTLATEARDLNGTVAQSSKMLGEHVAGVMNRVSKSLSHAGTYGRMGRVESKASVVSGLDVRH
ncbi:MAG: flagellar protein FlgN [Planctomycetota bacterium]